MENEKVTNNALLKAFIKSKVSGKMTQELVDLLLIMVERHSSDRFYNYLTYQDDMYANATLTLCRTWMKFKLDKSANIFAFYNTIIVSAFIQYISREIKEDEIRHDLKNIVDKEQHF